MDTSTHIYVAVVDDEESVCRSLGRVLRAAGIQPVTYNSAEEFLFDQKRPRFDCLVLDVQLNGMSGLALHQHLTETGSTTPVIYNTAHDEADIRDKAKQMGCAAYLLKSQPAEAVLSAIHQALQPGDTNHE
ncbi:response regulator [bacterium]|nr:response regulator [bacterium]